jgi:hypothetical protein
MRFSATGCTILLLLLPCAPAWPAGDDALCSEIVLDCSLAMKDAGPQHSARIDLAWQALARHYRRIGQDSAHTGKPPALRLAGGSPQRDNPWRPGQLIYDGRNGSPPFSPDNPLPPAPLADGLLLLSEALVDAAHDLPQRGGQSQGFLLLIAAGWEGGTGNPHDLANGREGGKGCTVIHVIGLAPMPAEARQLRQLAARSGGIYREVGGLAGLEQALHILGGSGGIWFTASSHSGEPPPAGSRLRVADRRGSYERDFDYQAWVDRGQQVWVPAGPYDLLLTCSGRSEPFHAPPLSVEQGVVTRRCLTLPERGRLDVRLLSPAPSTRQQAATISILDEAGQPVYRVNDRDECSIPLFPGRYQVRIRPYIFSTGFGELTREFSILPRSKETMDIRLPAEGQVVFLHDNAPAPQLRIEDRRGVEVWNGDADHPLSLPEGRYRLRVLDQDGERLKSQRFRIRGGMTYRLGPF